MQNGSDSAGPVVTVENAGGQSPVLVVCEHASNAFPEAFGTLGLGAAEQRAHIAWDPGAVGLARALARRLDATLVAAHVSRLVYDLNRPPNAPSACAETSEVYAIPGNRGLGLAERLARTEAVYLPFHTALHDTVARRLATGRETVIVTIHSFTPVWFGRPRAVEIGVIHDAGAGFATALHAALAAGSGRACGLNEPYSAADGVTHTLKLHALPYGLDHAMIEVRNDLIATVEAEEAMAATLAAALAAALASRAGRMEAAQ